MDLVALLTKALQVKSEELARQQQTVLELQRSVDDLRARMAEVERTRVERWCTSCPVGSCAADPSGIPGGVATPILPAVLAPIGAGAVDGLVPILDLVLRFFLLVLGFFFLLFLLFAVPVLISLFRDGDDRKAQHAETDQERSTADGALHGNTPFGVNDWIQIPNLPQIGPAGPFGCSKPVQHVAAQRMSFDDVRMVEIVGRIAPHAEAHHHAL